MKLTERYYKWRKKEKKSLHDQSGDAHTEVQFHFVPCSRLYQKKRARISVRAKQLCSYYWTNAAVFTSCWHTARRFSACFASKQGCIQNSNLSEPLEGW
ncbi:hypothetical protein CV945_14760 [Geobacillus sp. Manikaran-105]|nr:hypothetical protein CV945_14760 [Geobacillus sp. Manikaran-105]